MSRDVARWEHDHRFLRAFGLLLGAEGGYANVRADAGGETIYGVSRRHHPELWEDGAPTLDDAAGVAYREYWRPAGCDRIRAFGLAYLVFDVAYNSGVRDAVLFLQRALNLYRAGPERVAEDGRFGPQTRRAANDVRSPDAVVVYVAAQRVREIEDRVGARADQRQFLDSWGRRLRDALHA